MPNVAPVVSMVSWRLRDFDGEGPAVILAACADGSLWYRRSDWDEAKPWRPYLPAIPTDTEGA